MEFTLIFPCHGICLASDLAMRSSLPVGLIFAINEKAHSCTLRAPLHYLFWSSRACSAASSQNTSGARLAHYTCTQAIIVVVLAINDKHTLPVKHANNGPP
jgi:hypothetical protein